MIALHKPVLLEECLQMLSPSVSDTLFVDGTLGEGGHTEAFLKTYPQLHAVGVDADPVIQARAKARLVDFGQRVSFFSGWSDDFFTHYPGNLQMPDLVLLDLGISVFHYNEEGRGFSFNDKMGLDMRLSPRSTETAACIVNTYPEKKLADLIYRYGEERFSRKIAAKIAEKRRLCAFKSAKELADCIYGAVPSHYRHERLHPATKTFQALRIAVNGELERLPVLLEAAFSVLKTGGRLAVITFHSLEDRIVKSYFRDLSKNCICPPHMPICKCGGKARAVMLNKKTVKAGEKEIAENPPSRSARLRVIKKIGV